MVVEIAPGYLVATVAGVGVAAGLWLLVRGLGGYRSLVRVADTATSSISSVAAGEVRVCGIVEPAELTLVSLLQSVPCVYYRATVRNAGDDGAPDRGFTEERSIGFRVRDATGELRVFPRGARFDAPLRFEGESAGPGNEPSGLDIRVGGATRTGKIDRAVAAAELLRVHEPWSESSASALFDRSGRRSYRERRLEPGDPVTIVGRALPFADLANPSGADLGTASDVPADDPEVAADIAEARAAGVLVDDSASAWGNAAIAGFGIGRPVVEPDLDPAAKSLPLATPDAAADVKRTFEIDPETLVLAASEEVPLLIAHGVPGDVVERGQTRLIVGLLGAILAIASAMVLAISVSGGLDG
jgi:hypothetical protein